MRARILTVLIAGLCLVAVVWAGPITNVRGAVQNWLTTGSTLTNGGAVLSGIITSTSPGYQLTECIFNGPGWASPVAAQGGMALWVCTEVDGSNYENCDTTNLSPRRPDAVFPLQAGISTQQRVKQVLLAPPGTHKALLQNLSGVSLNTGATLDCKPFTPNQ
jgi:hypothetical protein